MALNFLRRTEMKPKIKVYPDYMSSGLWDNCGDPLDGLDLPALLGYSNMMALRYWHETWEFLAEFGDRKSPMSSNYWTRWNSDGRKLVEEFNKCQDKYEFIYQETKV